MSLGVQPTVRIVPASDFRIAGDHRAWDISWVSVAGNAIDRYTFSCQGLNLTTAYTGQGVCSTSLVELSAGGEPLHGNFSLDVKAPLKRARGNSEPDYLEASVDLPYNATGAEVQNALEALALIPSVRVERCCSLPGGEGGGVYRITFSGGAKAYGSSGETLLAISAGGLRGTGANVSIRDIHPGSRWGGQFALSLGGVEGSALEFDADAEQVREVVENLVLSAGGPEGSSHVWREATEFGYRWAVVFDYDSSASGVNLMEVRSNVVEDLVMLT